MSTIMNEPAIVVALLWIAFAGTHIGLATRRVRGGVVAAIGENGFVALYSVIAVLGYAALVSYYATHRFAGAPGLALGRIAPIRWALMAVVVAGVVSMVAGLVVYPRTPYALFSRRIHAPYGIERITRHGFFVGVALLALAHVLLATRLVGTVFMAGFAVLTIVGMWHQDRKLAALRGSAYADYVADTPALPFAGAGRARAGWRDVPFGVIVAGLAMALVLRLVHDRIFAAGGAWMVLAVVAGAVVAAGQSWRHARRAPTAASGEGGAVTMRADDGRSLHPAARASVS